MRQRQRQKEVQRQRADTVTETRIETKTVTDTKMVRDVCLLKLTWASEIERGMQSWIESIHNTLLREGPPPPIYTFTLGDSRRPSKSFFIRLDGSNSGLPEPYLGGGGGVAAAAAAAPTSSCEKDLHTVQLFDLGLSTTIAQALRVALAQLVPRLTTGVDKLLVWHNLSCI